MSYRATIRRPESFLVLRNQSFADVERLVEEFGDGVQIERQRPWVSEFPEGPYEEST